MAELLTLQDIATKLQLPPSTVRYYRQQYREFMPEVKAGRYSKYQPEAVEIIKFIAAATTATKQQQEIKELLSAKYPLNIEQNDNEQSAATTAATTTAATTEQQQTDISSKENHKALAQANKEIMRLSSIIDRLLDDNRELTRRLLQLPAARPWYKRIFDRD